jgi:hypothetical protein
MTSRYSFGKEVPFSFDEAGHHLEGKVSMVRRALSGWAAG